MEVLEKKESLRKLSVKNMSLRRLSSQSSWGMADPFKGSGSLHRGGMDDDEQALRWAAIEKLPTFNRMRTSIIFESFTEDDEEAHKRTIKEVDVGSMGAADREKFIQRVFRVAEENNLFFLRRLRARIDRVGIVLPSIEVRYEDLTVEGTCLLGGRALPTLWNATRNFFEGLLDMVGLSPTKTTKLTILKDVSGILKPSRMTLLLGPPGSGKTTLLLALAGRLDKDLKESGRITYNGHLLEEFVPQKTAAYIGQNDLHVPVMTVRETLDFSARCQGVGSRYDTILGDDMLRGISGGQKKRVTTGEMIVGPTTTLFMDEISTGLDSSTTYQIVKYLQQFCCHMDATILMSLLQPAPETYELFDDIILLSEGRVVYHGARENVLEFFESCGFKCPERKGVADFLQEVTSMKDQEQYWADRGIPYHYISVKEFGDMYKRFHVGTGLSNELSAPYDKRSSHKASLVFSKYSVPKMEIFKACFAKEWLIFRRNAIIYLFKTVQIMFLSIVAVTVFLRTEMHQRNEDDANKYLGALFFVLFVNMFNGGAELQFTLARLPVLFKQRDLLLYPAWAFSLPALVMTIPISILESAIWVSVTYYGIGFAPEAGRLLAGLCRTMTVASTGGVLAMLLIFMLGGFIIPKDSIPIWWIWGYWCSPLVYGQSAIVLNEMLDPRWNKSTAVSKNLGLGVLERRNIIPRGYWYWIGAAALLGYSVLFNFLFTMALAYLNPLGKPQAIISKEKLAEQQGSMCQDMTEDQEPRFLPSRSTRKSFKRLSSKHGNNTVEMQIHGMNNRSMKLENDGLAKRGMILPFTPLAMSFDDVNYFVDMPPEMKQQGVTEDRLQLLCNVTGVFRPGILTALMGVSGAGKTTLMDVLAGRKTTGYIEGDIRISGYPKRQETFARISGYCEQNDIHSPRVTVRESLIYSAFLRLPKDIDDTTKIAFVDEVMELVELDNLRDGLVGLPGVTGLSTEQRKRLTIAVELVANPSIIFMDEPTSGLDARAAAIVMRTVRNTVDTGRTVVCTIHQPNIDIFEAFDELLLMKRGGQVIYAGPLGQNSHKVVEYFEAIPGVPKIKDKYNPATWMLEVSSNAVELRQGIDFAEQYKNSDLFNLWLGLREQFSTGKGAAGMYSAMPYALAQVAIEIPCVLVQAIIYVTIVYSMIGFEWAARKFLLFLFINFFSFLYFTYYGMMAVSVTPNHQMAAIVGAAFYSLFNLFSGFFIPRKKIPKWWIWYYWICPVAWSVYGLIISQYGDVTHLIEVDGKKPGQPLNQYLEEYFGFDKDFMAPVALVLEENVEGWTPVANKKAVTKPALVATLPPPKQPSAPQPSTYVPSKPVQATPVMQSQITLVQQIAGKLVFPSSSRSRSPSRNSTGDIGPNGPKRRPNLMETLASDQSSFLSNRFGSMAHCWVRYLKVYQEAMQSRYLRNCINKGNIKFIPKVGNPELITNWQPITLLNVSYKIMAKALALWVASLLPKIVRPEQSGFVKGRFILDNLIVVWEGLEWARASLQKVVFLKIDFEKAYDHIGWSLILVMLKGLGFGDFFLNAIHTLFIDASSFITINGHQSSVVGLF
ncbi:hypothetical protein KI387_027956 [Taxus chinensis]|uniref:ABC transporter domain-containing protein n=1 Tax=Taxus chinensis TaxID=29808 RepID=A0AA38L4M2_TAXCH|nr:hypothetical protein KI387_027956 [Taxus chinensis]